MSIASASWTAPWCPSTGWAARRTGCTSRANTTVMASTCRIWSTHATATWCGSPTGCRLHPRPDRCPRPRRDHHRAARGRGVYWPTRATRVPLAPWSCRTRVASSRRHRRPTTRMVNSVRGPGERGFAAESLADPSPRFAAVLNESAPSPRPSSLWNSDLNHEVGNGSRWE